MHMTDSTTGDTFGSKSRFIVFCILLAVTVTFSQSCNRLIDPSPQYYPISPMSEILRSEFSPFNTNIPHNRNSVKRYYRYGLMHEEEPLSGIPISLYLENGTQTPYMLTDKSGYSTYVVPSEYVTIYGVSVDWSKADKRVHDILEESIICDYGINMIGDATHIRTVENKEDLASNSWPTTKYCIGMRFTSPKASESIYEDTIIEWSKNSECEQYIINFEIFPINDAKPTLADAKYRQHVTYDNSIILSDIEEINIEKGFNYNIMILCVENDIVINTTNCILSFTSQ